MKDYQEHTDVFLIFLGKFWYQLVNKTFQNDSGSWILLNLTALDIKCLAWNKNSQDLQSNYSTILLARPVSFTFFHFHDCQKNSRWPFSNKTAANVVIICVVVCCFPLLLLLLLLLFFCTFVLLSLSSPSCCADLSFQCWLMWQDKVCQATRLLRAKTHLARCVTWFATRHAMSCVSFPKFWTYLCAEKNPPVFWHRSKKWSKVRSCECRDPGAVRGIVIIFSKCYNSSRDALTQWGGSFKKEKNYKPEKDLPIESFVTTLIDGSFFWWLEHTWHLLPLSQHATAWDSKF